MNIKMVVVDIDGCLTDGGYYKSEDGSVTKKFNTRDFHGLRLLNKKGIILYAISWSNNEANRVQFRDSAPFVSCLLGAEVKLQWIKDEIEQKKVSWNEVAYIGDDVFDLPLLKAVGLAACPADAEPKVLNFIDQRKDGFIMTQKGGQGCVRELANMILEYHTKR